MNERVVQATVYAAISLLATTIYVAEGLPLVCFGLVTIFASVLRDGSIFETLADPAERRIGHLVGVIEFGVAGTILAAATVLDALSPLLFVGTVMLVGFGRFGADMARRFRPDRLAETVGFITAGVIAYVVGHGAFIEFAEADLHQVLFLGMAGTLAAALGRSVSWARHDGVVMLATAGALIVLETFTVPAIEVVLAAILVSVVLAYLAMLIGAASLPGLLTGVVLVFLTIVLGGLAFVAMLVAFFIIGGLATVYRYEDKRVRGVAEPNRGARGSGNVLGNTVIALVAILGYASVSGDDSVATVFLFGFAGALATALSDTLSSEIGGLYDDPLLITSLDRVRPGTDGAISFQGSAAGFVGASIIGGLLVGLGPADPLGGIVVAVAGFFGMLADSVLGALLEGRVIGNHAVNAMATLIGAIIAVAPVAAGVV